MRTRGRGRSGWRGGILGAVAALVLGLALSADVRAQAGEGDLLQGMTNFPQAQGDLPPTPLSYGQEQQVMDAVFSRFPNVDPHGMMVYIRKHFPDELQQYSLASMQNLGEAMVLLINLVRDALELQDLEARRPEAYALVMRQKTLERQARALVEASREGEAAQRDARLAELRQTLADSFQAKQDLMRADIAEIQRQVEELEVLVQERDANRAAIIERRVDEMVGRTDVTQW